MNGLRDSPLCASVGRISEAPSYTVKYLVIYYQYFMLSSGWADLHYSVNSRGKDQVVHTGRVKVSAKRRLQWMPTQWVQKLTLTAVKFYVYPAPVWKVHFRAVKACIDVYTTHIFTQRAGHIVPSKTAAGQEIRANFIWLLTLGNQLYWRSFLQR